MTIIIKFSFCPVWYNGQHMPLPIFPEIDLARLKWKASCIQGHSSTCLFPYIDSVTNMTWITCCQPTTIGIWWRLIFNPKIPTKGIIRWSLKVKIDVGITMKSESFSIFPKPVTWWHDRCSNPVIIIPGTVICISVKFVMWGKLFWKWIHRFISKHWTHFRSRKRTVIDTNLIHITIKKVLSCSWYCSSCNTNWLVTCYYSTWGSNIIIQWAIHIKREFLSIPCLNHMIPTSSAERGQRVFIENTIGCPNVCSNLTCINRTN